MTESYSPEHLRYLRQLKLQAALVRGTQVLLLVGIFVLWEVAASRGWINAFIFSQPTRCFQSR
jgi:NitT/TauT family transport system permease protein